MTEEATQMATNSLNHIVKQLPKRLAYYTASRLQDECLNCPQLQGTLPPRGIFNAVGAIAREHVCNGLDIDSAISQVTCCCHCSHMLLPLLSHAAWCLSYMGSKRRTSVLTICLLLQADSLKKKDDGFKRCMLELCKASVGFMHEFEHSVSNLCGHPVHLFPASEEAIKE